MLQQITTMVAVNVLIPNLSVALFTVLSKTSLYTSIYKWQTYYIKVHK